MQTRERILEAAKEFNYKPNFYARYLNEGRSYLIGVLSPDMAEGYDAALLAGIEQYLLNSEYHFFVASHQWSDTRVARTTQLFAERGVEGVILVNSDIPKINLPVVRIGQTNEAFEGTSIVIDNQKGIFRALEYLVSLGHRKIAFIKGHESSIDTEDRWNAVQSATQQLGLVINPILVVQLERMGIQPMAPFEEGMRCAEKLLEHKGGFTALLAFNDISAIGASNRFREAGWRIPEDVSIVGFDDVIESRITYPALTTIQQPLRLMGETAAREIIAAISEGPCDQKIVFVPELIVRNSTAPPRC